jgi:ubiquinone/menaquinone biosynthesis C-methylase UbiE
MSHDEYLPALRYNWLTSFYDLLMKAFMQEQAFKGRLTEQAQIAPGQRVLDVGCGTGTLTLLIKHTHPHAEVIGIDGDPKILAIARAKAARIEPDVTFEEAMSFELPYPEAHFDRVLSSLFFHHLTRANKESTLAEFHRVLKPGGEVHFADWGRPHNVFMRAPILLVQLLDGFDRVRDNVKGLIPRYLEDAGFVDAEHTDDYATILGTIALYRAWKDSA